MAPISNRMTLRPLLILVILITLGIILAAFLSARRFESPATVIVTPLQQESVLSMDGIRMITTRDGATAWNLTAESGNYLDDHNKAVFRAISVVFYTEDGHHVNLSADKGIYRSTSNDLEVFGHVVVKNNLYRIETEQLLYKHNNRILKTNKHVDIRGETTQFAADSMAYHLGTQLISLTGNMSGTIRENILL